MQQAHPSCSDERFAFAELIKHVRDPSTMESVRAWETHYSVVLSSRVEFRLQLRIGMWPRRALGCPARRFGLKDPCYEWFRCIKRERAPDSLLCLKTRMVEPERRAPSTREAWFSSSLRIRQPWNDTSNTERHL